MRVRDGPAAVRGDAAPPPRHWLTLGRRWSREPRVRRPAARRSEPLVEGGFVFRRTLMLSVVVGLLARDRRLRLGRRRSRACRRQEQHDLRRDTTPRLGNERRWAHSSRPASAASSTTASSRPASARTSTRSAAIRRRGSSGWAFKVNGASPPVGADKVELKDGDVVLWYWAKFSDVGRPADARAARGRERLLPGRGEERRREYRRGLRDACAWTPDACRWRAVGPVPALIVASCEQSPPAPYGRTP